ncbi:3-mercaptopyruvate sulfurtransferase [Oryzibacter oryziterrae]|uniref:3-mercaptopyruvate sulfurtransferase n=1 Tax=Oryzibacter oryziterrae TaxID=2766474 RepID=UPI001F02DD90|nr:3-mercaptopyruvate sulfurtransferase [Oryzibacter oryziterrae]
MLQPRDRFFVTPEWLAEHLNAPDVVTVDASWHMPASGRSGEKEYLAEHIPGAVFFDIDAHADKSTDLPHMLPRPEAFASAMRKLGIGDGQKIVVYDSVGLFSAPRVWWTFKTFGAADVVILDGGLPAWKALGLPLTDGPVRRSEKHFTARLDNSAVKDFESLSAAIGSSLLQIVDARSTGRFVGAEPEPRPGLKSGHMPGAVSLPFGELIVDGRLKQADAIRAHFKAKGVSLEKPIVTTCGSGVSAAILTLALTYAGAVQVALYDGSWSEWGGHPDALVVSG